MDQGFAQLWNLNTVIFVCICFIFTFFIRRVVETRWPSIRKASGENEPGLTYVNAWSCWWNKVILYFIPVFIGGVFAVSVKNYPFPTDIKTTGGRLLFGIFIGFFSSMFFKLFKAVLYRMAGVGLPSKDTADSSPPSIG